MGMYRGGTPIREDVTKQRDVRLGIRISRELRDAALEKARREDLTLSQVVRHFLRDWVAEDPPEVPDKED
jgi:hypothetical protein